MTQSINISNNLPDLGAPFLYWDRNENDKTSYCVETPYGFQLDLDFLKYVDDIQSGQTLKKMSLSRKPRTTRRSTSSLRSLSSQTGISMSTESLDYSEDGTSSDSVFFTRDVVDIGSTGAKPALGLRKSNPISPTPLFKLLPPPPARSLLNARVAEARKKQGQLNVDYEKIQSSNLSKLSTASRSSPNLTQGTLSALQYNKIGGERHAVLSPTSIGSMTFSPVNSGRNTPADNSSSTHLQYIREQMAASLKQLKDLEDQVKVIPFLQKQIYILEREKKQLTAEMEKYKACALGMSSNAHSSIHEIEQKLHDISTNDNKLETGTSKSEIRLESGISKPNKITQLKRLTEKLSDTERKTSSEKVITDKAFVCYPAVKEKSRKSVAVGENIPIKDSVFYYRSQHENKDVAVQFSTETKDVGVWVIESLLGLTCEAEKEIQILEHTIEHQRAVIKILENNLKAACDEMDELRVAISTRTVIDMQQKPVESSAGTNVPIINKPPEEYLQMVNTTAFSEPEMSATGIGSDIELTRSSYVEDVSVVDVMTECKDINNSSYFKEQLIPSSDDIDISGPAFKHELTILGRDEVDSADNITEKDVKDGETCATGASSGEKKEVMHQNSDEVLEDNADEDTEGNRALKSLDEVLMSCAQVLAS